MDEHILLRIDSLIEQIELVLNDTKGLSFNDFKNSDVLCRASCFSIAQIGEIMNHLSNLLSSKYKEIPWISARRMRNVIVHDYGHVDVEQIYSTIKEDLPLLYDQFLKIRKDFAFK